MLKSLINTAFVIDSYANLWYNEFKSNGEYAKGEIMGKRRVVGYIRTAVNTDSSIPIEYIKSEVNKHTDWELVEIYHDKGTSGIDKNRPMFRKMIEDGKANKFDYVVCKSIAKLSRDAETAFGAIEELKQSGIGAFFLELNLDTLSEEFVNFESIMKATNEYDKKERK